MTTEEVIYELFCRVDDAMANMHKHPQASLYSSEIVTLAFLFALKGVGNRAFYRWLKRDWLPLFPHLPKCTRLFKTHRDWTARFLAELTALRDGAGSRPPPGSRLRSALRSSCPGLS